MERIRTKKRRVIPGFGFSMGVTLTFLSLIVLIPMASIVVQSSKLGWAGFVAVVTSPRVVAGYRVSFLCSLVASLFNCVFGVILAWVLTRYRFPGKRIVDGLIELPFALPTAVAGIALTTLYSDKGWLGQIFARAGIKVSYTWLGIVVALTFVGLPFVVRAVQPVLEQLDPTYEEAAGILGARRGTVFFRVVFPEILPAMLTGFGLAFARDLGEYGSVVFIAGNKPFSTEIAPLLIMSELQQFNYGAATAIALVMLIASFAILLILNIVQSYTHRFVKD